MSRSNEPPPDTPTGTVSPEHGRGRSAGPPVFPPGTVLAGRFRIARFIAEGGMGEVYEAEDLELNERVALKTVRPDIAGDDRALARFRVEIHLARKVTHPNASRIYDVFHHVDAVGGGRDIVFLSMELLGGETLAERIRRSGRMTTAEAMPVAEQMAAGLSAAHRAGVIHRDFKTGNVMLVPDGSGVRAVVTDFGLARLTSGGDGELSVTRSADIAGTPAYMAPEQIEGGAITPATDVYALGVVLFEMVTGQRPFAGDTPVAAMVKRLKEPPSSPRGYVPDMDPRWESVILRCLARDPGDRYQDADTVVRALQGEAVAPGRRARRRQRRLLAAAVAVAVAAAAVALYSRRQAVPAPGGAGPAAAVTQPRRSVAVLGFKNLSRRPEADWLSTALTEMLGSELAAGEHLRTIPGETVARVRMELGLQDAETLARDTLDRARSQLGSDVLVIGSYTALGEKAGGGIRLDLRLQDAAGGDTIAAVSEAGTEAGLFELVSRTGARLREKLGVGVLSARESGTVRAALPATPEAARLYAEGLARLRLFDALGARERLEQAVAADPRHALTHAALAGAVSLLGHDERARAEARAAFDLAADLGREDRLSIEARYRETTREWGKAVEIHRSLLSFFPDNPEYGLRLASAQTSAGRGQDALATLDALRRLPPSVRDDTRIDLAEALAARSQADWKRAAAAASRAARSAGARGASLLLARARFDEGSALQNLGELDRATAALEEARTLYAAAGDRRGVAGAVNNLALIQMNRGDMARARSMFEEGLALYRAIGNQSGIALMQSNLGNVRYFSGDLTGARAAWAQTLETYRAINEKDGVARMLHNIASAEAELGRLDPARARFEEALAVYREIGDRSGVAVTLANVGKLLYQQGDLDGASRRYQEALALWREVGDKSYLAECLHDLGELLTARGELTRARAVLEEAVATREGLGAKGPAAASRLALSFVALEEGRPAETEAAARRAVGDAELARTPDGPATAHEALARALLAQGRDADAAQAAARAAELAAKTQNQALRLAVAITTARAEAAAGVAGGAARARRALRAVVAEAARAGLARAHLEGRLALAEIDRREGNPSARGALEAVGSDAQARGFASIARRASERK
jgi:tetratricopeptide (TPR) repeat protein/TolB-like protein